MSAARDHLAAIASAPRPAGGGAERVARAYCAQALGSIGCEVAEQPFEYSTFPGEWGTPIAGVLTTIVFLTSGHFGAHGNAREALTVLVAGAAVLGIFAWSLSRWGVLDLPLARTAGSNLVATRGVPVLWFVAHIDSKSQPIPIGVRAAAIIACIVLWMAATAAAVAQLFGVVPAWLWFPLTMLGVLSALPVSASIVGARSPGALDNASGVATVLRAAELLPGNVPVGVLLTSAEELGLAGARAWARVSVRGFAINVDGVDDMGNVRATYSGRMPHSLVAVVGRATGWPAPVRLPPGLLMDGVALADAGWEVLNVSKGRWRTVSRIHTAADDADHLEGTGIEEVAAMLARVSVARESSTEKSAR
ncbi:MAG: M28 family peptidase [Gemmatimonadota bacterium]